MIVRYNNMPYITLSLFVGLLKMKRKFAVLLLLGAAPTAYADTGFSAEFFASNNTKEITVQSAYARLTGQEQHHLQRVFSNVLQRYHIEELKSGDILGIYRMSKDKDITADNTQYVYVGSSEDLSEQKIFSVAEILAITLHQDSVAVFIPESSKLGDVAVCFDSPQPSISTVIHQIHTKLPLSYSHGFSLHLVHEKRGFKYATVSEVEWLGSKINLKKIKHAFPAENITTQNGNAYLIYQNGKNERL